MPAPRRRQFIVLILALSPLPFCLGQTQADMAQSAVKDYQAADLQLNQSYNKLLKTLDKPSAAKLKAAQLAWIKFRDADATFAGDIAAGGSLEPCLIATHAASLTQARTKQLDAELHLRHPDKEK